MLAKIKSWALYALAGVVVALAVAVNVLRAKNARFDAELARRERSRLQAIADGLKARAARANQAAVASKREREEAEKGMKEGRRDYFENQ
ncbi:hypothetical protein [Cardiobacterium hominis]|uniref:hypothetical protein n=1 Tax=Cardiobacterium hominis TaxID=2718 RepID=UPI00205C190B|nr:hypothetical protein [Cardiobacterium hominis]DAK26400.1 MAG TPA: hypothetical protein [Caudoviricetes sp.]